MNSRDRDAIERLIALVSGLKAEAQATNQRLDRIELSLAKHFLDDAAWMRAHDLKEAGVEGAAKQRLPIIRLGLDVLKVALGAAILYLLNQVGVSP